MCIERLQMILVSFKYTKSLIFIFIFFFTFPGFAMRMHSLLENMDVCLAIHHHGCFNVSDFYPCEEL